MKKKVKNCGGLCCSTTIPRPGSEEALAKQCKCAVMDHCKDKGFPFPREDGFDPEEHPSFWVTENCPLHRREGGDNGY